MTCYIKKNDFTSILNCIHNMAGGFDGMRDSQHQASPTQRKAQCDASPAKS
jgi:hypothetical protein